MCIRDRVTEALMDRLGYSEAIARKMLYGGGLSIYTTQDARIQAIVDGEINNPENYKAAYLSADYRLSIRHADGSMSHYSEQDIRKYHNEELKDNYNGLYANAEEVQADVDRFKAKYIAQGDEIAGESLQTVIQPQVSFVLMDQRTGEVKAISGGRGEKTASRTLNRATNTPVSYTHLSELQDEVVRLQKKYKKTVVFVTHDMDEAIKIATRICFLYNGRVIQCDTPENILKNPSNDYIRNFIGENRLWHNPEFIRVKDIMRKRPFTISRERTILQAMQIMRQNLSLIHI